MRPTRSASELLVETVKLHRSLEKEVLEEREDTVERIESDSDEFKPLATDLSEESKSRVLNFEDSLIFFYLTSIYHPLCRLSKL